MPYSMVKVNAPMLACRQFFVFVTGGVASAIIDIAIMQLMIGLNTRPLFAATAGFFVGLFFNYAFHAIFTFRSPTTLSVFWRFLVVVGLNYSITISFIHFSNSILDWGVLPGKIVSLPVVAVNGYLLSKYWVFR